MLAFILVILAQAAFAAYWPNISPEDAKKIMPVSEVKRGMRGYGLTVFQGTKIEKFDVEVLGVLKKHEHRQGPDPGPRRRRPDHQPQDRHHRAG